MYYMTKEKLQLTVKLTAIFVALEGFEPPQAEPESDVLPLHHKAMCFAQVVFLSLLRCKVTTDF